MKLKSTLTIFFVIAILAGLLPNAFSLAATQQQETYSYQVVCDLPRGENGVNYAGEGVPEMLTWGPTAFTVAPDGSFWIADAAANRLLQVNADCSLAQIINLEGLTVVPSDLEVNGNTLWVLDPAAVTPAVHRLGLNGQAQWRRDIPAEAVEGLTGIALDGNGQLLVEREAGASLMQLGEGRGNAGAVAQSGYTYGGRIYQARPADLTAPDNNLGMLQLGDQQVEVRTGNDLGGLYMLGSDRQGNPLFVVEEVAVAGEIIQVDQTVRKYDATGAFIGTARFPLAEQYTHVQHSLAIGPDGSLYALLTHPAGARIIRLNFSSALPAILPAEDVLQSAQASPSQPEAVDACITGSTIMSNAAAYVNNSHYYSTTNISGACTLRTKPVYLTTAGTYSSVSYDWNGFDTVASFNGYMSPNTYQAGDTETSGLGESCSRGVDCSGFVSRVWGLTTKQGTSTLPNYSWALPSVGSFVPGDIYNNPSSHVVLFRSFATNGANVYESTTSGYDRVIARTRLWSSFSGYSPRRYNNLCDPCAGQYHGEYYANRYLSGNPAMTRCEGWPINYNWGSGSPSSLIPVDNFSVRWLGTASFTAGTYTFIAYTDDGMKVWLDGTLIIDGWRDQGPTEYRTTRTVAAGLHRVQVEYYENSGGAVAQFRWVSATSSNLALNRTAYATSYQGTGYEPYRGNDGNTGTRWSSRIDANLGDQWWEVDLGTTQTFNKVIIRWEAAYAASHFVGWSNDGNTYTGYWYTISAPGSYSYSLGTHSNRWVAVLMRTRAPNMGNYSFWEFEVYNSITAILDGEPSVELLPAGSLETIILPPTE